MLLSERNCSALVTASLQQRPRTALPAHLACSPPSDEETAHPTSLYWLVGGFVLRTYPVVYFELLVGAALLASVGMVAGRMPGLVRIGWGLGSRPVRWSGSRW